MSVKAPKKFDVAIVGGGLAGYTTALMLADKLSGNTGIADKYIAIIAPSVTTEDGRTTALLGDSVDCLRELGIWESCEKQAAPLATMRILDGTNRIWRAPPVEFKAIELALDAFGFNIANAHIIRLLKSAIKAEKNITLIEDRVVSSNRTGSSIDLRTENTGTVSARLAIAADGQNSQLREDAGISVRNWQYPQTAIAVNLIHTLSHQNTSTEFHTEQGPFTLVPMAFESPGEGPGYQSGLVWIMQPHSVKNFLNQDKKCQEHLIEKKMHSMLGKIHLTSEPQQFPMSGMIARHFAANRVALVGDAAHVFPPIGAQGFNLGLRDIVEICELVYQTLSAGNDPGALGLLSVYDRKRRLDIVSRTGAVDLLNRSLLTGFLPVQALRGLSLFALAHIPGLRKFVMRQGMAISDRPTKSAA